MQKVCPLPSSSTGKQKENNVFCLQNYQRLKNVTCPADELFWETVEKCISNISERFTTFDLAVPLLGI